MRAVDYVDLGRYLHDVRESLNISIEQAAAMLNMRPRYLLDLENGKLDNLPGKAYIRGYIKNYSGFLQLDSNEVLEEYEKLLGGKRQEFFVPDAALHSTAPTLWIIGICLVGIGSIYGYWYSTFYDHAVARNSVTETPLVTPLSTVKIPADWGACIEAGDTACFLELQTKGKDPGKSETFAFIPPMPAQPQGAQPAPAEDQNAAPESSSSVEEDN